MPTIFDKHRQLLIAQEGYRQFPYEDVCGKLTIGFGRNLEQKGIGYDEALFLLDKDIAFAKLQLQNHFNWFKSLDEVRQGVLINMVFNLGLAGLLKFKKMLEFVTKEDWGNAAFEMLNSKWAHLLPNRAVVLANIMRTGEMPCGTASSPSS